MKTILISLLLVAAAVAGAADKAALAGKWQIHINIADHESDQSCTFVQNGNDLSGTCASTGGTSALTGKVDDKKITWTYKVNGSSGPVTLNYRGALNSATNMTGSVNVEEYGVEGEFTATQSN